MPTKISRYCLGIMEAAWLAAISIIPLFFNIYSSRIFEPDKITILRSLAILTLAAWVVKLVDEGGVKWSTENSNKSLFRYLLTYPLLAPVFGLILIYIISTVFSVTPSISFFGSYQRLQGAYTTFSYLIIFFSVIANLRTRDQINRLVTLIIFTSLPISLYGFLQRYNLDPIPWGGNVSIRIASTMGNSIFVAAYLIMVFPITVGRIIETFRSILSTNDDKVSSVQTSKNIIRATIYIFIALVQLIAIYMSGSRGPLLGLLAGGYFLLLLLSIYWSKRWLSFTVIGLAIAGVAFLAIFNINNGPLEALRKSPAVGRFGNLVNAESNSALVRQYIWEGDVKLAGIHTPLVFPDGTTDKFNFLRPLIGYGPESMYVAYNQFYQPELGQVEKRNASPDRSHNETWDSIIITGGLGLFVYLAIFSGVFYYGLKWLGLIISRKDQLFFWISIVAGGLIGTLVLIAIKGIEYLGVGLPFGMVIGVVGYLTIHSLLFSSIDSEEHRNPYSLLMIAIFAALIGHFIEINFGIAIVATRTLFWVYTGILLVVGFVLPKLAPGTQKELKIETNGEVKESYSGRRRDRSSSKSYRRSDHGKRPLVGDRPDWFRNAMIGAVIVGMIMATLGYDFITNSDHSTNFIRIIISSFTTLPNKDNAYSLGILFLLFLPTWIIGTLLFASETNGFEDDRSWLRTLGIMAGIALVIGILFWIFHAVSLALLAAFIPTNQNDVITQVNGIGSLLTKFYIYIFLLFIVLGFLLPEDWPSRRSSKSALGFITMPIALVLTLVIVLFSNLRVIHADITFKMAEPFANSSQWQVATFLYKRALELTPNEDHYYLFLGRSYLETAKQTAATSDQDALVLQAESDLKVAQSINPLNTDHTANLARLYTWWAGKATAQSEARSQRAQQASDYYSTAVKLSPNNSTLWDEWSVLYSQLIGQPDQAFQRLQHALSLDPKYNFTQGLLGDYYMRLASSANSLSEKQQYLQKAASYYQTAADVSKNTDTNTKASYLISLTNAYVQLANLNPANVDTSQYQQAIDILNQYIDAGLRTSDLWQVQETIAKLYFQLGDKTNAQYYASLALAIAPNSAKNQIQAIITQTLSLP